MSGLDELRLAELRLMIRKRIGDRMAAEDIRSEAVALFDRWLTVEQYNAAAVTRVAAAAELLKLAEHTEGSRH